MNLATEYIFFFQPAAQGLVNRGVYLADETFNGVAGSIDGRPAVQLWTRPEEAIGAGSTAWYEAVFTDGDTGIVVPGSALLSLTLSLGPTGGGVPILIDPAPRASGRCSVDELGKLIVVLGPPKVGDTILGAGVLGPVGRSCILNWTYGAGSVGRHQFNFLIEPLAGP